MCRKVTPKQFYQNHIFSLISQNVTILHLPKCEHSAPTQVFIVANIALVVLAARQPLPAAAFLNPHRGLLPGNCILPERFTFTWTVIQTHIFDNESMMSLSMTDSRVSVCLGRVSLYFFCRSTGHTLWRWTGDPLIPHRIENRCSFG